jgi:hypothetical protein
VRAVVDRELCWITTNIELLMLERMHLIDTISWWQKSTMKKYGPYLSYLLRFKARYEVPLLEPSFLASPPRSEAIPLVWAQLLYSLRNFDGHHIKFGTIRALRSAASIFYTLGNPFRDPATRNSGIPAKALTS